MTLRVHDDVANGAVDGALARVNQGTTNDGGKLQLWSGSLPENLDDAPSGTLLAEFDLQDPAFTAGGSGALSAGAAELDGLPLTELGLDDGQVGFVRVLDRDETPIWDDDDVGTSDANVILSTTTVTSGIDVTVESYVFSTAPSTIEE